MSNKKDTGGEAFPYIEPDLCYYAEGGMTLLDYFASEAMGCLLFLYAEDENPASNNCRYQLAEDAYDIAEAMLAEKRKREGDE